MSLVRLVCGVGVLVATSLLVSAVAGASSGHPLTAAKYRAEATAICAKAERSLNAAPEPAPGDTSGFAKSMKTGSQIESAEVTALKKLQPPTRLRPLVTRGLHLKTEQIALMRSLAVEAASGKISLPQAMAKIIALDDAAVWRKVGAPVCQY